MYAAKIALDKGDVMSSVGFLTVALAGFVGVLRFGFSESMFAQANGDLADVAGFVGLPIVGLSQVLSYRGNLSLSWSAFATHDKVVMIMALVCMQAVSRSLSPAARELQKIVTNLLFFVVPTAIIAQQKESMDALLGIIVFALAGIVITADRHKCILGVRC
jgi:hypothetical protein